MTRYISLIIAVIGVMPLFAQKAQIKASYDYHFFDPRGIEKHHDYILLAGTDCSKFYNEHTQWVDSMRCTDKGNQWYNQTSMIVMGQVMGKPRDEVEAILESSGVGQPVTTYIVKGKGKFKVWDMVYHEYRKYTEDIEERDWSITEDSVKTVLGYDCLLATANYHGRQWK